MAADIFLYDATKIPLGKDNQQHIEYARDIATKFNNMYGETFKLPELYLQEENVIPGIDGRKMSKSYNNYIGMMDDEKTLLKKVKQIPTQSLAVEEPKDPDSCNVYAILRLFLDEAGNTTIRQRYQKG
jgi:tryptophanyl-tRNA synthetase